MSPNDFERFHKQFRQQWFKMLTTKSVRPDESWFDKKTTRFDNCDYGQGILLEHYGIIPTQEERDKMIVIALTSSDEYYGKGGIIFSVQDFYQQFLNGEMTQQEFDGYLVQTIKANYIRNYKEEMKQVYEAHYA